MPKAPERLALAPSASALAESASEVVITLRAEPPTGMTPMSDARPTISSVHFPAFKSGLPSMNGKTVAITGTTSGTGRIAALTVSMLGAKVLLLIRPSSRSDARFSALKEAFPQAETHQVPCDL